MTSRHAALTVEGLTQASNVIAFVRCSDGASGLVTFADVPLNWSAIPYFAFVVRVALTIVPVRPLPERSVTVPPDVSSNAYAAISSGIVEPVVTVTGLEYGPRLV